MRFLEHVKIGEIVSIGSYTFTADNIKSFASRYDPHPFHLDEDAASRSLFKKLTASGWHTASVWMRLMVDHRRREAEARQARGEAVPKNGAGAGFRDLQWRRPVYVGDTISYTAEAVEVRQLNSRPGWGLTSTRAVGTNQHGEVVISFITTGIFQWAPEPTKPT